jgi:hypothetical protein
MHLQQYITGLNCRNATLLPPSSTWLSCSYKNVSSASFKVLGSDVDKASVQRYDTAETITVSQNIGNEIPNDPAQFFLDFSTHVK